MANLPNQSPTAPQASGAKPGQTSPSLSAEMKARLKKGLEKAAVSGKRGGASNYTVTLQVERFLELEAKDALGFNNQQEQLLNYLIEAGGQIKVQDFEKAPRTTRQDGSPSVQTNEEVFKKYKTGFVKLGIITIGQR